MFNLTYVLIFALLSIVYVSSYHPKIASRTLSVKKSMKLNSFLNTLTTAVVEVADKPDDYVYGAVAAPGWVLPLASVLVILSAALPFLLKSGEEALDQQRKDEESKGQSFGKKRDV